MCSAAAATSGSAQRERGGYGGASSPTSVSRAGTRKLFDSFANSSVEEYAVLITGLPSAIASATVNPNAHRASFVTRPDFGTIIEKAFHPAIQNRKRGSTMTTCLKTDGNSSVSVNGSNQMNFGNGDFTLECWIQPSAAGVIMSNKSQVGGEMGSTGYVWEMGTDGSLHIAVDNAYAFYAVDSGAQYIMDGNWHHVAAVRSNFALTLYVDGQAVSITTRNSGDPGSMNLNQCLTPAISGRPEGYAYMTGSFAEVRAWGVAQPLQSLQTNMYKRLTGTESGLVALWPFSDGTPNEKTGQYPSQNNGNCQYPTVTIPIDHPPAG
jgi:hypothetical protein